MSTLHTSPPLHLFYLPLSNINIYIYIYVNQMFAVLSLLDFLNFTSPKESGPNLSESVSLFLLPLAFYIV